MQTARELALQVFQAALRGVDSQRLVENALRVEQGALTLDGARRPLETIRRLVVVGFGKAGAGMARGVEAVLGPDLLQRLGVAGWVNVPEDCVSQLACVRLHGARPPHRNEPTEAGAEGARRICEAVADTSTDDLILCLVSGGGSALAPAPIDGVGLREKLEVTRFLSAAGADIRELNTVRSALSRIKGGGLLRLAKAPIWSLILSDVIGDPLHIIASGPTVDRQPDPERAAELLRRFGAESCAFAARVFAALEARAGQAGPQTSDALAPAHNVVIGNNDTALRAARQCAESLGLRTEVRWAEPGEAWAESVGRELARQTLRLRSDAGPRHCWIWGGEPTVKLAPEAIRGRGGRNQQAVLAGFCELARREPAGDWAILSGGADGEDGPTDAAGAVCDPQVLAQASAKELDAEDALRRNDAYHFFEASDGLVITGPTHTNVCDIRVVIA